MEVIVDKAEAGERKNYIFHFKITFVGNEIY